MTSFSLREIGFLLLGTKYIRIPTPDFNTDKIGNDCAGTPKNNVSFTLRRSSSRETAGPPTRARATCSSSWARFLDRPNNQRCPCKAVPAWTAFRVYTAFVIITHRHSGVWRWTYRHFYVCERNKVIVQTGLCAFETKIFMVYTFVHRIHAIFWFKNTGH